MSMRATIKCVKVLSSACRPRAVIVARFRGGATYAALTTEERWALKQELSLKLEAWNEPFPRLLRIHAIDPETGKVDLGDREGLWTNAEELWVRTDAISQDAVNALSTWRQEHPRQAGVIHAPNWLVLTAVRILALAAELPDPMDPADLA